MLFPCTPHEWKYPHAYNHIPTTRSMSGHIALHVSSFPPIDMANVVKQFLRELPNPLLTSKYFHLFLAVPSMQVYTYIPPHGYVAHVHNRSVSICTQKFVLVLIRPPCRIFHRAPNTGGQASRSSAALSGASRGPPRHCAVPSKAPARRTGAQSMHPFFLCISATSCIVPSATF